LDFESLKKRNLRRLELVVFGEFHHYFVRIDPFTDGNDGNARILTNWSLQKHRLVQLLTRIEEHN